MKKLFNKIYSFFFSGALLSSPLPLQVDQGGTGVSTITGILQGNGVNPVTPVTIGAGLSYVAGTLATTGGSGDFVGPA